MTDKYVSLSKFVDLFKAEQTISAHAPSGRQQTPGAADEVRSGVENWGPGDSEDLFFPEYTPFTLSEGQIIKLDYQTLAS